MVLLSPPYGTAIVFSSRRDSGDDYRHDDIWVMDPFGGNQGRVTDQNTGANEMPTWLPVTEPISITWTVPARFGLDGDGDGLVNYPTTPEDVQHESYRVDLKVAANGGSCDPTKRYDWFLDGVLTAAIQEGCVFHVDFPREGEFQVTLNLDQQAAKTIPVVVQDWLVVSIGDSIASAKETPTSRRARILFRAGSRTTVTVRRWPAARGPRGCSKTTTTRPR